MSADWLDELADLPDGSLSAEEVKAMLAVVQEAMSLRAALDERGVYPWPALDIALTALRERVTL